MSETAINIVRLADVVPQQWKNGGGVTRVLLAWPNTNDWVVRVSVADIERDGPFSRFVGVDRHFAVLKGKGVRLTGVGELSAGCDSVCFGGELAPNCELIDGPTRDLNVMIQRDAGHGRLLFVDKPDEDVMAPDAKLHGVYFDATETLVWTTGEKAIWLCDFAGDYPDSERFWHFSFFANF